MLLDFIQNGMAKINVNNRFKNLIILILSSIISLLILEIGVRVFIPQDRKITWIEMHERGFVMNQSGGEAYHEFESIKVDYRFTEQRTRGDSVAISDTNQTNILAIGDSFTFGLLLNERDTYLTHLQNWVDSTYSTNLKFHNAAVGGAGLADWLAWLELYGSDFKPDKVIYFLNNQDVFRALSKNLYVLPDSTSYSLIESQRWEPRSLLMSLSRKKWYRSLQSKSDLMNILVKILWRSVYFNDLTKNFSQESSLVSIPKNHQFSLESSYSLHLSIALISNMKSWCIKNGCELIVTNTGYLESNMTEPHTLRVHEFLIESDDYNYLDIQPCVSNAVENDYSTILIPNDTHPNKTGAKLIADCLIDQLPFVMEYN